jgi:hypothetical protein
MARHDIILNDQGDLLIKDGDFVVGESDQQHVELLLSATKGSFLQYPTIGVGLANYVNKQDVDMAELRRAIEVNLKADGYKVNKLITEAGNFNVDYEII